MKWTTYRELWRATVEFQEQCMTLLIVVVVLTPIIVPNWTGFGIAAAAGVLLVSSMIARPFLHRRALEELIETLPPAEWAEAMRTMAPDR